MLSILYEDAELLVVNKPAGLVCHPTKGDAFSSLVSRLRLHRLGEPVWLVHRLDRETSGVTVAAKSRPAAAGLNRIFEARGVTKEYLAIVHGHIEIDAFSVDEPLGKDLTSPVVIQDAVDPAGSPARTNFALIRRFVRDGKPFSLVRALPLSGRKHQIRVHLAHAGYPIVGDKIYGGDPRRYLRFVEGNLTDEDRDDLCLEYHALHAARLEFVWHQELRQFTADPEPGFAAFASI